MLSVQWGQQTDKINIRPLSLHKGDRAEKQSDKTQGFGRGRAALLWLATRYSAAGLESVKPVEESGILPRTNKPHNRTVLSSEGEHSFSLPQVLSVPVCTGVAVQRWAGCRSGEGCKQRPDTGEVAGGWDHRRPGSPFNELIPLWWCRLRLNHRMIPDFLGGQAGPLVCGHY